ncbi:MAG: RNA methyltransferase tRNA(m5U54)methyltransferase [Geoglossum simile]|nr:MAG: RNA methyltransferase tRNA(m5U54)methyltransferase [Geoglossum simile]
MDIEVNGSDLIRESSPVLQGTEGPPMEGQMVNHKGKRFTTVKEGLAYILIPTGVGPDLAKSSTTEDTQRQSVFYNPIQQFNRDLSVLAIRAFGEESIKAQIGRHEKKLQDLARKGSKRGKKRKIGDVDGVHGSPLMDGVEIVTQSGEKERNVNETASDPAMEQLGVLTTEDGGGSGVAGGRNRGAGAKGGWKPHFSILDALSATGLRALRYCQEIPFTTSVTANDLSREATSSINLNIKHNRLDDKIVPLTGNAISHMYQVAHASPRSKYDVIDLDPYGTAAPFLDAAVQALSDGGLLCVTCTDSGVFASGGYPEKTYALYGGLPIKGPYSHEGGLRLVLHAIATSAARYGLAIEPLLSLSIDFYVRMFVRVRRSPAEVKFLAGKTMIVYCCDQGCGAWKTQLLARNKEMVDKKGGKCYKHSLAQAPSASEHCECCGFKTHLAGPMYAGPIQSRAFIQRILDFLPEISGETYATAGRIEGMLSTALDETGFTLQDTEVNVESEITHFNAAEIDTQPFYFIPNALCKVIHCQGPSADALRGAFRHLGYRVTASHCKAGSFKTNAPWPAIWHIFREWVVQKSPIKEGALKEGTAGWSIIKNIPRFSGVGGENLPNTTAGVDCSNASSGEHTATALEEREWKGLGSPIKLKVVFDEVLGREKDTKKIVRYQQNPRANWGPLSMAKGPRK